MNFALLDVAIGLALVYLLMSMLCSGLQEMLAAWLNRRGKYLWNGIEHMLMDQAKSEDGKDGLAVDMLNHPLVKSLVKAPGVKPSYIPSETFAVALADLLGSARGVGNYLYRDFPAAVAALPDGDLKKTLQLMIGQAQGDAEKTKLLVQKWFDDAMDRVSGWYKRWTHAILLIIGIAAAVALNVDSVEIGERLWRDPILRAAMVQSAQAYVESHKDKAPAESITAASKEMENLQASQLPIGWPPNWWTTESATSAHPGAVGVEGKMWRDVSPGRVMLTVAGWLITAIAVSLGAPFWFDALSKLVSLKAAGPKPDRAGSAASATGKPTSASPVIISVATPSPSISPPDAIAKPSGAADPFLNAVNRYEATELTASQIRNIQTALGMSVEGVSGILDQKTRDKIRERQVQGGYQATGELSAGFSNSLLSEAT